MECLRYGLFEALIILECKILEDALDLRVAQDSQSHGVAVVEEMLGGVPDGPADMSPGAEGLKAG